MVQIRQTYRRGPVICPQGVMVAEAFEHLDGKREVNLVMGVVSHFVVLSTGFGQAILVPGSKQIKRKKNNESSS
jgi:hypothetical protein